LTIIYNFNIFHAQENPKQLMHIQSSVMDCGEQHTHTHVYI